LPSRCCQPAVARGFICADFRGCLTLTWPHRLCLLRVFLCVSCCYKLSPFQAHWGRWHCTSFLRPVCLFTVHVGSGSYPLSCGVFLPPPLLQAFLFLIAGHVVLLLLAGMFVYSSRGKWVFLSLLWSFPLTTAFTSFPAPGCYMCAATPAFSGLACLFTVLWGIPLPPSALRVPHSLCYMSLLLLLLITQFLFFPLGGDWSVQGNMLIWPRVVCGSTTYPLAHLVVCIFPSRLGTAVWWWPGGPPGFSV
jgi:hypothetical protein